MHVFLNCLVYLLAFHPRPQIASDLGRNVTRSPNPHPNRKRLPSGNEMFGLWPQTQIATGLNLLRFANRKPNPPLYSCFFELPKSQPAGLVAANRKIAVHKATKLVYSAIKTPMESFAVESFGLTDSPLLGAESQVDVHGNLWRCWITILVDIITC